MTQIRQLLILIMLLALFAGSACQRRDALRTSPAETTLEPRQAAAGAAVLGQQVAWGGTVIRVENREDRTRLEVLAYPLDADGVPRVNRQPSGRFLSDHWGFLDPADYTPGRRVTVRGNIAGTVDGKVGEAIYRYPLLEAAETRLWETVPAASPGGWWPPQLHIGIGVYGGI